MMSSNSESNNVVELEDRKKWEELGRGVFSVVWKAYCSYNNGYVAVKEVKKGDQLLEVRRLIPLLVHNHVLKIRGIDIGRQLIINEFCSYSLQLLRDTLGNNFIPWPQCRLFIQHIMGGLEFLHDNGVVHGGLKPTNVMVNDRFICKIADFGPAGSGHPAWADNGFVTSAYAVYVSPRLLMDPSAPHTKADDIYSCAMLLYKMITNADIFDLERRGELESILEDLKVWVTTKDLRPDINQIHSSRQRAPSLVETIIRTSWDGNPDQRKPVKYWVKVLREDNKATLDPQIIAEATCQLKQLLRRNKSDGGASCGGSDVPRGLSPVEDKISRLSVQDGIEVKIINGSDIEATRCYNLILQRSYRLNFDKNQRLILFKDCDSRTTQIPIRSLHSAKRTSRGTVVLFVAVNGTKQIYSLELSVSSVERTIAGLKELSQSTSPGKREEKTSKEDEITRKQEQLRSSNGTAFNGLPIDSNQSSRSSWQHTSNSPVPNGMPHIRPQTSDGQPQAQQQTFISVQIMNAKNVIYGSLSSAPVCPGPPPYHISELTESTEIVSVQDMTNLQDHVVVKYEAVGRGLGLEMKREALKRDHAITEASYRLLKAWVDQNGNNATKARLAHILYETGLYDAAKML